MEIVDLRKDVAKKRFGIEVFRGSDKDAIFYTGLPSAAVFDSYYSISVHALMYIDLLLRGGLVTVKEECSLGRQSGEIQNLKLVNQEA